MHLHHLLRGIMQYQTNEVEGRDGRQALRKVPKQRRQVPLRRDRLGDLEKGLALIGRAGFAAGW
jgi:hypothetical protein